MYPIPPTILAPAESTPRDCIRSEAYDVVVMTRAATAYGGTVSNCASAFAVQHCYEYRGIHGEGKQDLL